MGNSAVQKAYEWLRHNIAMGTLRAGTFIEEANVVEATGVSRTPVREAFHRLAGERYLELVPRRGAQIRHITARDAAEIYDARRAIETFAARQVCQKGIRLTSEVDELLSRMDDFSPLASLEAGIEFRDLDREFHRAFVSADGNRLLVQLYDSIWPQQERVAMRTLSVLTESSVNLVRAQHREILAALRNRDAETAVAHIEAHLRPVPGWNETLD
ncbi:GntR family transcriptional regulator [Streptomyces acidicola]|uniref:GntR family transcriptional regulator n=1 Tax=Streptomyces acidicola TaxID=2596892 RepID=UPI00381F3F37